MRAVLSVPVLLMAAFYAVDGGGQAEGRNEDEDETRPSPRPPRERPHPLANLASNLDNSWLRHLQAETPTNRLKSKDVAYPHDDGVSNNVQRPMYNGHHVSPVRSDPLRNPKLVIYAPDVADSLGLTTEDVHSDEFVAFVSGDVESAFADHPDDGVNATTWATPYALSIMGKRYTHNDPYERLGMGTVGYGDGRAISIGEFLFHRHNKHPSESAEEAEAEAEAAGLVGRYELQLKGAGPTPFCRGADGRAVLRSSVREFLASEAMHHLGVPTTRALSLVVSEGPDGCTALRPWYSGSDDSNNRHVPDINDPRLAGYSMERRREIIANIQARQKNDPDIQITEPCAITCRASPSFVRVGHFDLYARRVQRNDEGKYDTSEQAWSELEQMLWHAAYRDFRTDCHDPFVDAGYVSDAAKCLIRRGMDGLSTMVSHWVRVGFAQGNFNADNCLVSGRTVDYGPFGFMDEYHPLFAKWTGSGEHFGFMNQPEAGLANFMVLLESVLPVIEAYAGQEESDVFRRSIETEAKEVFQLKVRETFRLKLGFPPDDERGDDLWAELEGLLRGARADWTVFWRQLTRVATLFPIMSQSPSEEYTDMLQELSADENAKEGSRPFYAELDSEYRAKFTDWIREWRAALQEAYREDGGASEEPSLPEECMPPEERMRIANPKYTLREWMLVEAYTKASAASFEASSVFPSRRDDSVAQNDESTIHELYALLQTPYDEGTDEQDRRYYRRAPDEALRAGGTAYMS